jgi:hypothetical protein
VPLDSAHSRPELMRIRNRGYSSKCRDGWSFRKRYVRSDDF